MSKLRTCSAAIAAGCWVLSVQSQPAPASDIPMADYLALLAQIAPAAREGAEAYRLAVQRQCHRALTSVQLRRAMAEGSGDPVLMGMIGASQRRDTARIAELGQRVDCRGSQ